MRYAVPLERAALTFGAASLLFSPLFLELHHERDDHEETGQHIEAPHGDHGDVVAKTSDRLHTTLTHLSLEALPATSESIDAARSERAPGPIAETAHPPARAPPPTNRSRAPPLPS